MKYTLLTTIILFSHFALADSKSSLIRKYHGTFIGENLSHPSGGACAVSIDADVMTVSVNFTTTDLSDNSRTLVGKIMPDFSVILTSDPTGDTEGLVLHLSEDIMSVEAWPRVIPNSCGIRTD